MEEKNCTVENSLVRLQSCLHSTSCTQNLHQLKEVRDDRLEGESSDFILKNKSNLCFCFCRLTFPTMFPYVVKQQMLAQLPPLRSVLHPFDFFLEFLMNSQIIFLSRNKKNANIFGLKKKLYL